MILQMRFTLRISILSTGGVAAAPGRRDRLAYGVSLCNAGVEFVEVADAQQRTMAHFPLGAMGRSGFSHVGPDARLPDYFSPMDVPLLLEGHEPLLKVGDQ